jgi:hypothetical protein
MPQLWQISPTEWINPAHIVHIKDYPERATPTLHITMLVAEASLGAGDNESYTITLDGRERADALRYMAQAVTPLSR